MLLAANFQKLRVRELFQNYNAPDTLFFGLYCRDFTAPESAAALRRIAVNAPPRRGCYNLPARKRFERREIPICQSRCLSLTASEGIFRFGSVPTATSLSRCKTTGGTCEKISALARKFGSSKVGAIPAWKRR